MKKETAINSFKSGIQLDMNPLTIESDTLTDCLNGTIITNNGNEYMLQNDMGNGRVETAMLPSGYTPLGITSFGGIIYILSYNPLQDRYQFGSFPSPERNFSQDELTDITSSIIFPGFYENAGSKIVNKNNIIEIPLYQIILYNEDLYPNDKFKVCSDLKSLILKDYVSGISEDNTSFDSNLYPKYIKFDVIGVMKNGSIVNLTENLTWNNLGESLNNKNFYIYPFNTTTNESGKIQPESTFSMLDEYRGVVNSQYDVFTSKYSGKLGLIAKYEAPASFSVGCQPIISELYQECQDLRINLTNDTLINQTHVLYNNIKARKDETIKISFYYRLRGMKLHYGVLNQSNQQVSPHITMQLNKKYNWTGKIINDTINNSLLNWTKCELELKIDDVDETEIDDYIYLRFDAIEFIDGAIEISNFNIYNQTREKYTHVPKLNLLENTQVVIKELNQNKTDESGTKIEQTTFPIYQLPYQLGYLSKYYDPNKNIFTLKISFKYKLSGFIYSDVFRKDDDEKAGKARLSVQFSHDYGYAGINPTEGINNLFLNSSSPDDEGYYTFEGESRIGPGTKGDQYDNDVFNELSHKYIFLRFVNTGIQSEEFGIVDIKDFEITRLKIEDEDEKVIYSTKDDREFKSKADIYYNLNWTNNNKGKHKNRVNPQKLNVVINNKEGKDHDIILYGSDNKLHTSNTLDNVDYYTNKFDPNFYKDNFNLEAYLIKWNKINKTSTDVKLIHKLFDNNTFRKNDGTDSPYFLKGPSIEYNQSKYKIIGENDPVDNNIIDFEFTPVMPFGQLKYLRQQVSLDLSKLGTGYIELSKYQYFNTDQECNLTFSFDTYLEANKKIHGIILNIYPFNKNLITETKYHVNNREYSELPVYSTLINEEFYNLPINHTINFGQTDDNDNVIFDKNDIYQLEFMVVYDNQVRYYYRVLHTSNIFNVAYNNINYKDFADLYLYDKDQLSNNIGINFTIEGNIKSVDFKNINIQKNIYGNKINFNYNINDIISSNHSNKDLVANYYYYPDIPTDLKNVIIKCDIERINTLLQNLVSSSNILYRSTHKDQFNIKTTKGHSVIGFSEPGSSQGTPDLAQTSTKSIKSTILNSIQTPNRPGELDIDAVQSVDFNFNLPLQEINGYQGCKSYSTTYQTTGSSTYKQNHWYINNNKLTCDIGYNAKKRKSIFLSPKILRSAIDDNSKMSFKYTLTSTDTSTSTSDYTFSLFYIVNEQDLPIVVKDQVGEFDNDKEGVYNELDANQTINVKKLGEALETTNNETKVLVSFGDEIDKNINSFRIGFMLEVNESKTAKCSIDDLKIPVNTMIPGGQPILPDNNVFAEGLQRYDNVYKTTVNYSSKVPVLTNYFKLKDDYTLNLKERNINETLPIIVADMREKDIYFSELIIQNNNQNNKYLLLVDSNSHYIIAEINRFNDNAQTIKYVLDNNSGLYDKNCYEIAENPVYKRSCADLNVINPYVDFNFGLYLGSGEVIKGIKNLTLNNLNLYPISNTEFDVRHYYENPDKQNNYFNGQVEGIESILQIGDETYLIHKNEIDNDTCKKIITTGQLKDLIQCEYDVNSGKYQFVLSKNSKPSTININGEEIKIYLYGTRATNT